ncbi:ferritin, partial [Erwinia amylovora]|nr:ferritin [Erwinia amylovora]
MTAQLYVQLKLEFYSAKLSLQVSAWCTDTGGEGAAALRRERSAVGMAG